MKYEVCVGVDVCAYGSVRYEADSDEAAIEKAKDILENNMPPLEPNWESQDQDRIVEVLRNVDADGYGEVIAEDIYLVPSTNVHEHVFRLLKACRSLLDMVTDNRTHGPEIDEAVAAIAAAEGKELSHE